MQRNLSTKRLGTVISAVLAVPYVLVMFASLLLVSTATTGSWQAALLGITWSTAIGFELGLVGIVIASFVIALAFVPAWNVLQRQRTSLRAGQAVEASAPSRALRLLITLLVLVPLTLLGLRAVGSALSANATGVTGPDGQLRAMSMGSIIDTSFREAEPSFTADGRTMYFNCRNYDICVSHLVGTWEEGNWTTPELVGAPISTAYEEIEPVISANGDKLYFTSTRPDQPFAAAPVLAPFINVPRVINMLAAGSGRSFFGGLGLSDVWVSYQINGVWSVPQNINDVPGEPQINTPFEDHCLFFSADGNEAFWTSTRPGGFGNDDIWTSHRVDGKWTAPENLGPNVNTAASEHTSVPTPDGRSLYITTTRAEGFGGEDNYITTRDADGTWGPPVNLGPLVNGPGDDRCPAWTPDLKFFIFDSVRQGGAGGRDIWWVYFDDVMDNAQAPDSLAHLSPGVQASNDVTLKAHTGDRP